jgi:putative flippase GtrA
VDRLRRAIDFFCNIDVFRFFKFLSVGGTVFVFNTLLLWIFKRKLLFGDSLAISFAYFLGFLLHFTLNNFFTFSDADTGYRRRFAGYIFTAGCNYLITLAIGNLVFKYLIDNVLVVNIASVAATTIFSYLFLHRFVFFHREKDRTHE